MASVSKLFLFTVFLAAWGMKSTSSSPPPQPPAEPTPSLMERLQSNESSTCWDAMLEIHSCIGEAVLFFLNGEAYMGPGCCRAIRTIVNQCRPAMLEMLGFTPEESHVLDDYCEREEVETPPSPPPLPSTMVAAKPADEVVLLEDLKA
ncbi:hypothetical protein CsSME_00035211 [Camellia sinensis var. sinensis]|uniref:Prolamin-like domain-containing protein n=1 Tax=Camellia sinensis var. sinensis TaxID=542762 RepID=A0A4S4D743_CAMSN|nr:egg cell-secreted protein 1.4-like [Camellia sinensis]THF98229.1 hypothetical protein TEA_000438 [Camellia sinensis var. sinensis]